MYFIIVGSILLAYSIYNVVVFSAYFDVRFRCCFVFKLGCEEGGHGGVGGGVGGSDGLYICTLYVFLVVLARDICVLQLKIRDRHFGIFLNALGFFLFPSFFFFFFFFFLRVVL